MKTTTILAALAAILLLPAAALAQDGGSEEFDTAAAMKKVRELLRQSEKALAESLRPDAGAAKTAAESGEAARKAIEELLRSSRENGENAVKQMTEILEKAPRGGGGGGGQDQQKPSSEEDARRKAEEEKVGERDPGNSGQPKDPAESKDDPKSTDARKPKSETGEESDPNPDEEWLANLPDEVRQDYLNKDFGKIPQRWREFIESYVKRLAEMESSRNR